MASATTEFRLRGFTQIVVGIVSGALAAAVQGPRVAIPAVALGAAIFGGLMYLMLYRRRTRQILQRRTASTDER